MGLFMSRKRKDELLSLQKIVIADSPDRLICSEKQLKSLAIQKAENSHRIMNDCANLLQTTVNPDVFFDRLQLFVTHCCILVSLEKYISFNGASPTEIYNTMIREKQDVINGFIVRYFNKVYEKAESLKTEKGKMTQYKKFYESLKPYFNEMSEYNINYIKKKSSIATEFEK